MERKGFAIGNVIRVLGVNEPRHFSTSYHQMTLAIFYVATSGG